MKLKLKLTKTSYIGEKLYHIKRLIFEKNKK